jgi:hypothetical protein
MSSGEIAVIIGAVVAGIVKLILVVGAAVLFVTRTGFGRRMFGLRRDRDDGTPHQLADQVQDLQAQLDDVHSRLDFAERVMVEQREQLRTLGAPEPRAELREPTPV